MKQDENGSAWLAGSHGSSSSSIPHRISSSAIINKNENKQKQKGVVEKGEEACMGRHFELSFPFPICFVGG